MGTQSAQPSTRRLVRSGALAGAIAAVCTTVVAAIASAADVSLEINATAIPIPALAWWTIIGAALGIVFARKPSATEYGGASRFVGWWCGRDSSAADRKAQREGMACRVGVHVEVVSLGGPSSRLGSPCSVA